MVRKFLVLVGVIVVIICALLFSLYVLDVLKLPELREDLGRIFGVIGICTAAGLLIMFLVRAAEKK